ncbi:MAG: transcription repressor NadR [Liquorilactobacillus hordei]|uniref:YrxA n=1 Tax=Liquorilactobacillus hordei DSM 19519 TaxID=1423759 RepID=A0A0R1MES3_9LACO|nr:transcription repressor NadR [Liquorilactobacillus hordei]KRL06653.1 YrxA [Liquorilactobacillus hordei DSM 19519]MBZ2405477.1 hydrolase [Liquorilactobacillus hordei]QYH51993.1 transcription repressor NadR [Liquorilactobacillus hordei DSM 19519]
MLKNGNVKRRAGVRDDVLNSDLISATTLAKKYKVSRQTIVGDIALLRAKGEPIIATVGGYKYQKKESQYHGLLVCQHTSEETRLELETIVSMGGEIEDVIVDHKLYGQLVGTLGISTLHDVNDFMSRAEKGDHQLLSSLTMGIHLHNVACNNEEHFLEIKQKLSELGLLYLD